VSLSHVLILLGGVLEIAGVLVVVREIARDLQRAVELEPGEPTRYPVAIGERRRSTSRAQRQLRKPPTDLGDRVAHLEKMLAAMEEDLREEDYRSHKELVHQVQQRTQKLRAIVERESRRVDRVLAELLRGQLGWRAAGVGLIVAGVILNVVGSLL
jgi:chromosome segregation ATPase